MDAGRVRQSRVALAVAPLLVAVLGCGGGGDPAVPVVAVSPSVVPAAVPAVAADYPGAPGDTGCDPRQSLTPPATLPRPNQLPPGSTMEAIRTKGRLKVGVDQNTIFFASLKRHSQQPNTLVGFDIEMALEVGRAIFGEDGRVDFVVITQAQRIPALQNGTVDLVVNTMTITCDRKKQVAFSGNYYDDGQRVLVPYDSRVTEIEHLAGQRVCTARVTTSIVTLRDSGVRPYAVDNWTDCLVALQRGEVEAVSTTGALLAGLAEQDRDTKVVGRRFTDEPHGMAVRLDRPDFVRFLNALLRDMIADGRWQAHYNKWLLGALGAQSPPITRYAG